MTFRPFFFPLTVGNRRIIDLSIKNIFNYPLFANLFWGVLRIRPKKGRALMWFNFDSNGEFEIGSFHGGCFSNEDKYYAIRWMYMKLPEEKLQEKNIKSKYKKNHDPTKVKHDNLEKLELWIKIYFQYSCCSLYGSCPKVTFFAGRNFERHFFSENVQNANLNFSTTRPCLSTTIFFLKESS